MSSTGQPVTGTLITDRAVITYDVRANPASTVPALLLIGSPMGAAGFVTLAGHFQDRTVVTYDPRGSERSHLTGAATTNTPEEHADDLYRLIEHLGLAPVDLFASSGGAVNALALAAAHPEVLRVVVAHEPPLVRLLPDAAVAERVVRDMHDTYLKAGFGPAMAKFIALLSNKGELTEGYLAAPAPDPAMFGLPTEDDGSRDDALLGLNMLSSTLYEPDMTSLGRANRSDSPKVVIAAGEESAGELAHRGAVATAQRLGVELVMFPSDHAGFAGGEYGQTGKPAEFAAKLREVLG